MYFNGRGIEKCDWRILRREKIVIMGREGDFAATLALLKSAKGEPEEGGGVSPRAISVRVD